MENSGSRGVTQVTTSLTGFTLTANSPPVSIYNSATAPTQALPTAGLVDGQAHVLKNLCTAAVNLSVTGNVDSVASTTVTLAQFASNTFTYCVALATWVKT